jgi:peptide/nickel transport system permease protein
MAAYILRRVLSAALVVVLVSVFVFLAINAQKGSVIEANIAGSGLVSPNELAAMRHELQLDRSPVERYLTWWHDMLFGCSANEKVCYGNSLQARGVSIWREVADALPNTVELLIYGMALSLFIAVPIGVISAVRQDSLLDDALRLFAILGLAVPTFFLGILIVIYGSRWFDYAPPTRIPYIWNDPIGNLKAFFPPALLLGLSLGAVTMRMTRSALLEVLRQDFVRTARAKGLRERRVVLGHAFRNSALPVLTIVGNQAGFLLGGSVIVESIFNVAGIGLLAYRSISNHDYTQVLATTLVLTIGVVAMNLIVDLLYATIDPRVRYA